MTSFIKRIPIIIPVLGAGFIFLACSIGLYVFYTQVGNNPGRELSQYVGELDYQIPLYTALPEYISGGWAKAAGFRLNRESQAATIEIPGSTGSPLALQQNTTLGVFFSRPDRKKINRVTFDYIANYDTNLLVAGMDYPSKWLAWTANTPGNFSASVSVPDVDWVAFSLFVTKSHPGVPASWGFRIFNVKLYSADGTVSGDQFTSYTPQADEYVLASADNRVVFVANAKFGGSITKIFDQKYFGNTNLIEDGHGGALLQNAFWLLPRYQQAPEGCDPARGDMWYQNPTQGGYYADVVMPPYKLGNPIGFEGNDSRYPDKEEFIRYENNNKTIHLKTKMIRHDYCKEARALIENKSLWDTEFYLEQWLELNPTHPQTLKIQSKLMSVSANPLTMDTRQFPIIFAKNLPSVASFSQGQKIITPAKNGLALSPDKSWAALIAQDKEAGLGLILPQSTTQYLFEGINNGTFGIGIDNFVSTFNNSATGHPKLETFGQPSNVATANNGYTYTFSPGGSFTWTVYVPVGTFDQIKTASEAILADPTLFGFEPANQFDLDKDGILSDSDFTLFKQYYGSKDKIIDFNQDGVVNVPDYRLFSQQF